ncbi:hypothetical protein Ancab_004082 [Ancistrocladus abbreviatus]
MSSLHELPVLLLAPSISLSSPPALPSNCGCGCGQTNASVCPSIWAGNGASYSGSSRVKDLRITSQVTLEYCANRVLSISPPSFGDVPFRVWDHAVDVSNKVTSTLLANIDTLFRALRIIAEIAVKNIIIIILNFSHQTIDEMKHMAVVRVHILAQNDWSWSKTIFMNDVITGEAQINLISTLLQSISSSAANIAFESTNGRFLEEGELVIMALVLDQTGHESGSSDVYAKGVA